MRVLYILSSTAMQGGSTKAFLSMLSNLQKYGVRATIVCPKNVGGSNNELFMKEMETVGVDVFAISYRANTYPEKNTLKNVVMFLPKLLFHFYLNGRAYKKLLKICREEMFDIIHTNVSVINIGYKVALKLKIPHIYHIREYQDLDFGMKIIPSRKSFIGKLSSAYSICITHDIQKHFCLESSSRSKVIYDGVKSESAIKFDEKKGNYFLFVGRLQQSKGIEDVIRGYAEYVEQRNDPMKLLVAGLALSVEYQEVLMTMVDKFGLGELVVFLGVRNDVDELMLHANALIMASYSEGFGLVTAEAMFNGCLVLARNCAGTKEQVDNGRKYGGGEIALTWNTITELGTLLQEVDAKKTAVCFSDMIEKAQKVVVGLYSSEKNAHDVYLFYEDIVNGEV